LVGKVFGIALDYRSQISDHINFISTGKDTILGLCDFDFGGIGAERQTDHAADFDFAAM
jgi:hypothetical protein